MSLPTNKNTTHYPTTVLESANHPTVTLSTRFKLNWKSRHSQRSHSCFAKELSPESNSLSPKSSTSGRCHSSPSLPNNTLTVDALPSHSFGSVQTYGLVDAFPTIFDGIILTRFSLNFSFQDEFLIGLNFVQ